MTTTEDTPAVDVGAPVVGSTVYGRPEFQNVDVGAIMRDGHPDVADGDRCIVEIVVRRRAELGRPLTVIDIGSGSGVLTEMLALRLPDCRIIANDDEPSLARQARERLHDLSNAEVFDRSYTEWDEPLDVVISWGTHHHMPHSYLAQTHRLLGADGTFIGGDEFCPEYCTDADNVRIRNADVLQLADGYILTSQDDIEAYEADGTIGQWAKDLEQRRRITLWNWYKFVIDFAIERGHWSVALCELQITRDDLVTDFEDEHKISPLIFEHEVELAGFHLVDKNIIGDRPAGLQSFFIYEYTPTTV